jgi:hypothetical protein
MMHRELSALDELPRGATVRTTIARWQDWSGTGVEHLVLREELTGVVTEAALLAGAGDGAFAARYRIACDPQWRTRRVEVRLIGDDRRLEITADGAGNWRDGDDHPLAHLQGAIDVDLSASPFTNTLPIRRLDLKEGEAAEILAVYVLFPDLTVMTDPQRYTCLDPGRRYRYESRTSDFMRDIEVDANGLVVTYPGLFKRIH